MDFRDLVEEMRATREVSAETTEEIRGLREDLASLLGVQEAAAKKASDYYRRQARDPFKDLQDREREKEKVKGEAKAATGKKQLGFFEAFGDLFAFAPVLAMAAVALASTLKGALDASNELRKTVADRFKGIFGFVVSLQGLFGVISAGVEKGFAILKTLAAPIMKALSPIFSIVKFILKPITMVIGPLLAMARPFLSFVTGPLKLLSKAFLPISILMTLVDVIVPMVKKWNELGGEFTIKNVLLTLWAGIEGFFKSIWTTISETAKLFDMVITWALKQFGLDQYWTDLKSWMAQALGPILEFGRQLLGELMLVGAVVGAVFMGLVEWLRDSWPQVKEGLGIAVLAAVAAATFVAAKVTEFLDWIVKGWNSITDTVSSVIDGAVAIWDQGKKAIENAINTVKQAISQVVDIWNAITDWVADNVESLKKAAMTTIPGVAPAIGAFDTLKRMTRPKDESVDELEAMSKSKGLAGSLAIAAPVTNTTVKSTTVSQSFALPFKARDDKRPPPNDLPY